MAAGDRVIRLATRASPLAIIQAGRVGAALERAHPGLGVELVQVTSRGDAHRGVPIEQVGGAGVFTKALEEAILGGEADAAVHSAKDMPTLLDQEFVVAAYPERANPLDALVGRRLDALGPGAVVGTSSPRRRAQLAHARPDLLFADLRGNMDTRLGRVGELEAVVAAAAALERLGRESELAELLGPELMLPAPGQGAIAVESIGGSEAESLLSAIDDVALRQAVESERACIRRLGGGCTAPVAAHATRSGGALALTAAVCSRDGHRRIVATRVVRDSEADGETLAAELLSAGGADLLGQAEAPA